MPLLDDGRRLAGPAERRPWRSRDILLAESEDRWQVFAGVHLHLRGVERRGRQQRVARPEVQNFLPLI